MKAGRVLTGSHEFDYLDEALMELVTSTARIALIDGRMLEAYDEATRRDSLGRKRG